MLSYRVMGDPEGVNSLFTCSRIDADRRQAPVSTGRVQQRDSKLLIRAFCAYPRHIKAPESIPQIGLFLNKVTKWQSRAAKYEMEGGMRDGWNERQMEGGGGGDVPVLTYCLCVFEGHGVFKQLNRWRFQLIDVC